MTIQLTIVGLGQIGGSIGLALAEGGGDIHRLGTDIDSSTLNRAGKIGAVDKTTMNLGAAVRGADIIILALPLDQVDQVAKNIVDVIKPGAVLMDTAPAKAALTHQLIDTLPDSCCYVGLTPVLNPRYLHSEAFGILAARADLFQDGLFCVTTPPGLNPQALQLAVDLIQRTGAEPLFVDLHEIDGLMAAVHFLPQLMSIALLNATLDQPGWNEARKIAGRPFAEISGPAAHLDDAEALIKAVQYNDANIIRKMDDVIEALQAIRQEIARDELEALEVRIKDAKAGVDQWWKERGIGNWLAEEMPQAETVPTSAEVMGGLFGFGLGRRRKKDR